MTLFNSATNSAENISFIQNDSGIFYVDKMTDEDLNSLGYFKIQIDNTLFDYENFDYEKKYTLVGNVCVQSYIATQKAIEVPQSITMLQARKILRRYGLFDTVNNAILASSDEELKDEWEYALDVKRNWDNLINMSNMLGISSSQLDQIFIDGSKL